MGERVSCRQQPLPAGLGAVERGKVIRNGGGLGARISKVSIEISKVQYLSMPIIF